MHAAVFQSLCWTSPVVIFLLASIFGRLCAAFDPALANCNRKEGDPRNYETKA
jgi:hypothetical protein